MQGEDLQDSYIYPVRSSHRSEYILEPDNTSRVDVLIDLRTFENGVLEEVRLAVVEYKRPSIRRVI